MSVASSSIQGDRLQISISSHFLLGDEEMYFGGPFGQHRVSCHQLQWASARQRWYSAPLHDCFAFSHLFSHPGPSQTTTQNSVSGISSPVNSFRRYPVHSTAPSVPSSGLSCATPLTRASSLDVQTALCISTVVRTSAYVPVVQWFSWCRAVS